MLYFNKSREDEYLGKNKRKWTGRVSVAPADKVKCMNVLLI